MKAFAVIITVATKLVFAQKLQLDTPTHATQCMDTHFNWIGGIGPFSLYIHMNDDRTNILQTYNNLTYSPFHWATNISASDTRLQALLIDQFNGTEASSGNFTINPSTPA
ncbi:hypothetical protein BC629DRAFT_332382 [Irpex lacteus]|nr:hypothetical protein BC629DRAFT_332382 [Irpex lacteus]